MSNNMRKLVKHNEKKERNKKIKRLIRAGKSTREVGRMFKLSNKRIWDIVHQPLN